MTDNQNLDQMITRDDTPKTGPQNAKERVYEKLRMPLWLLDAILALLGVAVVAALVVGYLKGKG